MIRNYIASAIRYLKKNKLYLTINTIGLSVALSASFLILLYVINELSFDNCHKNRDRVFRVINSYGDINSFVSTTPYNLARALKDDFPQVEKITRTMQIPVTIEAVGGNILETALSSGSDLFAMFTFKMISGDSKNGDFDNTNSLVISDRLAKRIFGKIDVFGENIKLSINDEDHLFTVAGVYKAFPENSSLQTDCIICGNWSVDYVKKKHNTTDSDMSSVGDLWMTWLMTANGADINSLNKQVKSFSFQGPAGRSKNIFVLQPLSDVYLRSENVLNSGLRGSLNSIRIFSSLALLIILVAAINYIMLSSALSAGRSGEIAIRKAYGAAVTKIRAQFLYESFFLISLILPLAIVFTYFCLPFAEKIFQVHLYFIKANIGIYILSLIILVILIAVFSGFYTSFYLSQMGVLDIINHKNFAGRRNRIIHSVLVVIQLFIFCLCMAAALTIRSQYKYEINKETGFNTRDIVVIDLGADFKNYKAFVDVLKTVPDVISVAGTNVSLPLSQSKVAFGIPNFQNKDISVNVEILNVDFDFIKTMGMKITSGRDFSRDFTSDLGQATILNETAVKALGISDPLGKEIFGQKIIGVVKDFNLFSIHSDISPLAMSIFGQTKRHVIVHFTEGQLPEVIGRVSKEYENFSGGRQMQYTTIESIIEGLYSKEKNLTVVVSVFAFLALLIVAFGLSGLTLYLTRARTREIGIRKVNGSSGMEIIFSFLWENIRLAIIAFVVSVPVTYYIMGRWLEKFRINNGIDWSVVLISGICAIIIVLLSVLYHCIRASRINPVEALRSE